MVSAGTRTHVQPYAMAASYGDEDEPNTLQNKEGRRLVSDAIADRLPRIHLAEIPTSSFLYSEVVQGRALPVTSRHRMAGHPSPTGNGLDPTDPQTVPVPAVFGKPSDEWHAWRNESTPSVATLRTIHPGGVSLLEWGNSDRPYA